MLLIILALFWVALLTPLVVRRLRDNGTERSIESFHAEHQVLGRQGYTVPPAHRLDQHDEPLSAVGDTIRRPRLTVVHADDTYRSLESRNSWREWSDDYDFDGGPARREAPVNHYAAAYSSVPSESTVAEHYEPPYRRRSMKTRRRVMLTRIVLASAVLTVAAFVSGYSVVMDLAVASWICVVGFVALALYAVSQGYLHESSLPLRLPQRRPLATIQPLYDEVPPDYEEDAASEFYDADEDARWQRESRSRRAFG